MGLTCLLGDETLRLCLKLLSFLPKRVLSRSNKSQVECSVIYVLSFFFQLT